MMNRTVVSGDYLRTADNAEPTMILRHLPCGALLPELFIPPKWCDFWTQFRATGFPLPLHRARFAWIEPLSCAS